MKTRLKELRKKLKLTQQAFGSKLGLSQNTIAQYEMGRIAPSNSVVKSICKEYGVNEKWLHTGEGDMFVESSYAEEIEAFLNNILTIDDEQFKKRLIVHLAQMDDSGWDALEALLDRINNDELFKPAASIEAAAAVEVPNDEVNTQKGPETENNDV